MSSNSDVVEVGKEETLFSLLLERFVTNMGLDPEL